MIFDAPLTGLKESLGTVILRRYAPQNDGMVYICNNWRTMRAREENARSNTMDNYAKYKRFP